MPAFFAHSRGCVVRVAGAHQRVSPFTISVDGMNISRAIMVQANLQLGDNYQALHTLDDRVFVSTFGRKLGELVLTGAAFADACYGNSNESGIDNVQQTFEESRLANNPTPLSVMVGRRPYQCILVGMQLQLIDAELNIAQFSLKLASLPAAAPKKPATQSPVSFGSP